MKSQRVGKTSGFVFMLMVLLASVSCYGNERQEEPPAVDFAGFNVEANSTADRDLVKVGVWLTDQGKLVNAGIFYSRVRDEKLQYGVDIAAGYLTPVYRLWPFVEMGVKIGADTSVTGFHVEAYPKIGIAVPLSGRMLMYAGYQYSYSTQGRRHDYSAASIGLVWGVE
jgi:hypothetical protein